MAYLHPTLKYSVPSTITAFQALYLLQHQSLFFRPVQDVAQLQITPEEQIISTYVFVTSSWQTTGIFTQYGFRGPCTVIYSYNKRQRDALFLRFI